MAYAPSTIHPIGSPVVAPNGKTYTVVGYTLKNGVPTGSMVTVKNDEGIRFIYPASQLTPMDDDYYGHLAELQEISEQR